MINATSAEPTANPKGNWPDTAVKAISSDPDLGPTTWNSEVKQVVVIIAPAECISLLGSVLKPLHMDLPAAILILVHGHSRWDRPLSANLNRGRFPVEEGRVGSRLRNGHALIIQADDALVIGPGDQLQASREATGANNRSILLRSMASHYPGNVITVALTELEPDESELVLLMRSQGGQSIALDDSGRGWLNEHSPLVIHDSKDRCIAADDIGFEIATMLVVRAGHSLNPNVGVPERDGLNLDTPETV